MNSPNANESLTAQRESQVSVRSYLLECRTNGRAHISSDVRESILRLRNAKDSLQPDERNDSSSAELTQRFADIEFNIYVNGDLNYSNYLNLPLLERFVVGASVQQSLERCRLALAAIVTDWLRSEERAAALHQAGHSVYRYSPMHVEKRIVELKKLANIVSSNELPFRLPCLNSWISQEDEWFELEHTANGVLGLILLTCLPQSKFHDEIMFIRITHVAECCFIGARLALTEAYTRALTLEPADVCDLIKQANTFVSTLLLAFTKVFRTLPIENFYEGFRPETGGSSAIQSSNYQRLDGMLRGFSSEKRKALVEQPLVSKVFLDEHQNLFVKLLTQIKNSEQWSDEDTEEVEYYLYSIRRNFCSWQKFHIGVARTYIPTSAQGTGGMGIDYLKTTLTTTEGQPPKERNEGANAQIRAVKLAKPSEQKFSFYWLQMKIGGKQVDQEDPRSQSLLADLLHQARADSGAEIYLFDSNKLLGDLRIDSAKAGEYFVGESGELVKCKAGEQVVRDAKSIVSGVVSGASHRALLSNHLFNLSQINFVEMSITFNPFNSEQEVKSKLKSVLDIFEPYIEGFSITPE